ncbi:RNA 3'-terminal phosphate cyclase [Methanocella paludicola SANAE]|uniref:RNA 3'-terminal phosphate cyclase n=1 Tax=Methanocella paludicola (strain DSM 17711 / JCM 13418 / NBRC 101707 / SANAE) TaxID=304371 RepID=D1Z1E5_METPS|nr:RNA 3'-terminal phosphate cyclase [Methanocella paludicola]BAI62517.1 RNA 3'-terminal phosphate cyclase [Methanocella paludicola SANAE]
MLLTVDGSVGEGGGQILRTAIALSAIMQKAVRIVNIRKSRPRPGLGIQHVKSIEIARDMTDASVEGLRHGSTEVTFHPGPIKPGNYTINMGTAGSITLALQSILPIAAYAPGPVTLDMTGGTDVKWAPPYDYFHSVTMPALARFGFHIESSLLARGFFPAGNGHVIVRTSPSALQGIDLTEPCGIAVEGVSASSHLPSHVCERQAKAAVEYLRSQGYDVGDIQLDIRNDTSLGSSITLYKGLAGGIALGERGKPAEKVGREAASQLAGALKSGAAVDAHLADQLIIYMALSEGESSISASRLTDHTAAGIRVVEQMTGRKFEIKRIDEKTLIRSSGTRAE